MTSRLCYECSHEEDQIAKTKEDVLRLLPENQIDDEDEVEEAIMNLIINVKEELCVRVSQGLEIFDGMQAADEEFEKKEANRKVAEK